MQASAVLNRVQDILQDTTGVRWPESELIRYLNDAQREVVLQKPDAKSSTLTMDLVAGTKQVIPSEGLRLLEVIRNIKENNEPGNAVTLLARGVLDAQVRSWHSAAPSENGPDHYIHDARDPKTFYIYPPTVLPSKLEVMISVTPTDVTTPSDTISLDPIYANVLIDYMLYRAYSKDADFAANENRMMLHYQAFASSLGLKMQMGMAFAPRANQRDTRDSMHQPPMQG